MNTLTHTQSTIVQKWENITGLIMYLQKTFSQVCLGNCVFHAELDVSFHEEECPIYHCSSSEAGVSISSSP